MSEEALEELKQEINNINAAVEKIRDSGISWNALYILVQHACPAILGKKPTIQMIRAVFEGFDGLKEFVFPENEE